MAEQWLACLAEVRRQAAGVAAAAGVQPPDTDGTWYDVAEGTTETSDLETVDESGAWRGLQWLNAFEILFFERPSQLPGSEQQDDLLFFVVHEAYQGDANAVLLVRRRGKAMPGDLGRGGPLAERINWSASVLLNLVIQAGFELTVATCRRTDIHAVLQPGQDGPEAWAAKVSKAVYASPMNVQVNLEGGRATEERPSVGYPSISFGVEDFEEAFKSMVLTKPGWCYVVSLAATGGLALTAHSSSSSSTTGPDSASAQQRQTTDVPADPGVEQPSSHAASEPAGESALGEQLAGLSLRAEGAAGDSAAAQQQDATFDDPLRRAAAAAAEPPIVSAAGDGSGGASRGGGKQGSRGAEQSGAAGLDHGRKAERVTSLQLFTGFVSYEQLEDAMGTWWERQAATRAEATHWVKMRGPGGQGHADVAITCLAPLDEGHISPSAAASAGERQKQQQHPRQGVSPFTRALDAVAQSAKVLVRDALGSGGREGERCMRLRCALMRLSLPVELLAAQLLQLHLQP